jgi:hypothetical protein
MESKDNFSDLITATTIIIIAKKAYIHLLHVEQISFSFCQYWGLNSGPMYLLGRCSTTSHSTTPVKQISKYVYAY